MVTPASPRDLARALACALLLAAAAAAATADPAPPPSPERLIFIHHSCGENWLADDNGGLGIALRDNNYFVSDTNYGWGPHGIGDLTDIGHWWNWFLGPDSATYLQALYGESGQNAYYSRLAEAPAGENRIILFKSCYPNAYLSGDPDAPATAGDNPLRGEDAWSEHMTVANAKGIYTDLLDYFAQHTDKLFIALTAPPQAEWETDATHAANARAFTGWLVDDWLDDYPHANVAVFDFYNVLTSNGGDADTNDLNQTTGNHHRWRDNTVQHTQTLARNTSAYPTGDSHPSMAGNLKATAEFVPLLNHFYSLFIAPAHTSCAPGPFLISDTAYSDSWRVGSETTLSTAGTVTVAAGANVTFEAADAIALNAGFSVQSGGLFAARLGAVVCN